MPIMTRLTTLGLLGLLSVACATTTSTAGTPEPPQKVAVKVEQITHPMIVGEYRDEKDARAMYHVKDSEKTIDWTGPLVTLNNGHVEVKIVPTLAMRVLNAIDLSTGCSMAGTEDPRFYETQPFRDIIGWTAGFVEVSFPYFEHGTAVTQNTAWRTIEHEDGSVTVAMKMYFTEHQEPRHRQRYGRYDARTVSSWVTLKPGEKRFSMTYRLDNPTPLRRSDRIWTNVLLEAKAYDEQHIIYPVGYISPHGAGWVKPFFAEGGERSYTNVSHFGLYPEHRFSGVYDPERDINHLIIRSESAPGKKLYTPGNIEKSKGFLELWYGSGVVFEDPGSFVKPYEPVEYTLWFYQTSGIGRVQWADETVAVGKDGELAYAVPEERATQQRPELPLTYADTTDRLPKVKASGGKFRHELESISNHIGAPTDQQVIPQTRRMIDKDQLPEDPEVLISRANTLYRYGQLAMARTLLEKLPAGDPDADYLRGLIAWEEGRPVDFGKAGLQANYHRALLAIQSGQPDQASTLLRAMIAETPTLYRPRLLLAYLTKDRALAAQLSAENPSSPEALLVLNLLGDQQAGATLKQMIEPYPAATEAVEQFRMELTKGQWQHPKRYAPLLPKESE